MGCVSSTQRFTTNGGESGALVPVKKRTSLGGGSLTPSVAYLTEGVVSEIIRSRRRSIRNTGQYDAVKSEEISVMVMLQSMEENAEISQPEQECIVQALKENVLFSCMQQEQLFQLAKFMFIQIVEPGEKVVTQGEIGDKFFVVRSGKFDVMNATGEVINRLTTGATFGELGLLYSAKRTASVIADPKTRGSLYALRGKYFRYVAAQHSIGTFQSSLDALKKVKLLENLTEEQLAVVADSVQALQYRAGDVIVHKGEQGSVMYMIHSGTVICTDIGNGGGAPVELSDGDYFGERALLASEPRAATVIAKTDVHLMVLDQQTFSTLLGPLQSVLNYNRMWRALETVSVLKGVPFPLKKKLIENSRVVTYEPNQAIVTEGDEPDAFYIVKDGDAKVVQRAQSPKRPSMRASVTGSNLDSPVPAKTSTFSFRPRQEKVLEMARLGTGDVFGEMAIINHTKRMATVTAITRVECLVIGLAQFEELLPFVQEDFQHQVHYREAVNADKIFAHSITLANLQRIRNIGLGSYGIVYMAVHTPTGRMVAVKEMWKSRLENCRQVNHIRSEKALLSMLDSLFILKYLTFLQDERKIYFVTEILSGGELFRRIVEPSGTPIILSNDPARFYAACCIKALEFMHERNIAYRDLKPENILLDSAGYAKLVDFGFAKKLAGKTYTLCGTPEYLAPEIILGVGHTTAVDNWGVGVLIYEMIMGDSPFAAKEDDHLIICRNILQERIRFPANCDETWKEIVLALLHKHPEKRASFITGSPNDVRLLRWFQDFSWDKLMTKTLEAPWKPDVQSETDSKYFQTITDDDMADHNSWEDVPPALPWDKF
ncbi:TPA: hypothetical protein N0F65_000664 [Lagenidium giganteum]|uniref:cGMP-dependent protein kinase n=1 Tax=Lagenidium giganteum TaxID=4803 RepID=A0AAV2YQU7_9STRA|nr:TPA: hypothetical protein N0F65_000664 [Lagenidium giganteum]